MVLIQHIKSVPGQYFVKLKGGSDFKGVRNEEREYDVLSFTDRAERIAARFGCSVLYIYYPIISAFAVSQLGSREAELLSRDEDVEVIEQDTPIINLPRRRLKLVRSFIFRLRSIFSSQMNWALDRINQESPELDGDIVRKGTGKDVRVYVIDTGVNAYESIFSRLSLGHSVLPPGVEETGDRGDHGTSVAAVIGGLGTGVAPDAEIFPVRVWDGRTGSACSIAKGVTWVAQQRVFPAVANISLVVPYSQCLNDAIEAAQKDIQFVVAAGDGGQINKISPASTKNAVTVAGSRWEDEKDYIAKDSNLGELVDIFAPGESVLSYSSAGSLDAYPGTSYAAALVSGALALYLEKDRDAVPAVLRQKLIDASSKDKLSDHDLEKSPNRLLNINF